MTEFLFELFDISNRVTLQIDFGNLAVGLATVIIAFVTFWVSLKSIKGNSRQKLSEYRHAWIEDLRDKVALHLQMCRQVIADHVASQFNPNHVDNFGDLLCRLDYSDSYLRLKLNPNEKYHQDLVRYTTQIRKMSLSIRRKYDKDDPNSIKDELAEYNRTTLNCINCCKTVLKTEWDKMKHELGTSPKRSKSKIIAFQAWEVFEETLVPEKKET